MRNIMGSLESKSTTSADVVRNVVALISECATASQDQRVRAAWGPLRDDIERGADPLNALLGFCVALDAEQVGEGRRTCSFCPTLTLPCSIQEEHKVKAEALTSLDEHRRHAHLSNIAVARMVAEAIDDVTWLARNALDPLRKRANDILLAYPPEMLEREHYVGNPLYASQASTALQVARLFRDARVQHPNLALFSDTAKLARIELICELACSPIPPADLFVHAPGGPAQQLPLRCRIGDTVTCTNILTLAETDSTVQTMVARSVAAEYKVQDVLDRATRAELNPGSASRADLLLLHHLRLLSNGEGTPGQTITGGRIMLAAKDFSALPEGEVKTVLYEWRDASFPLAELHMRMVGRDPGKLDIKTLCLLIRAGKVQIWHFDAKGPQLVMLTTPGYVTRVMMKFDELGLPEAANLKTIADLALEPPIVPDSNTVPALTARAAVAATAALLAGVAKSREVRGEDASAETGTRIGDPFVGAASGLCVGFVALGIGPGVSHQGPERDTVQIHGNAEVQQRFMLQAFSNLPMVQAVVRSYSNVFLERHTLFCAETLPTAEAFGCDLSLLAQDYTTDKQFRTDVMLYELGMGRSLLREVRLLYNEGHTEIADYYDDGDIRPYLQQLFCANTDMIPGVEAALLVKMGGPRTRASDAGAEYMGSLPK